MARKFQWGRMSRNVLATVALAGLVVGGLAPATRAAVITFNANGGGATPNTTGVTGFTYNTGDVDIQSAITPGTPPVANPTGLTAYYQSVLTTVNGSTTLNAGTNYGFGGSNNYQFTVVAGFSEQFAGTPVLGPAPGGGSQVTTTLQLGGGSTNFFEIFANTATNSNTANFAAGTGFGGQSTSTLVLAGTIQSTGFVSQFNELGTVVGSTFVPTTQTFDPNAPLNGDTKYNGMSSVVGNGSTNLSVTVAVSLINTAFFPNPNQLPLFLNFQTTSSLPFGVQVPSALFYNSTSVSLTPGASTGTSVSPNLGGPTGTNGVTGPDFMFQANSSNSFAVPEPGSITMALTAMGLVSLAGGLKAARRRRSKTSAV